MTNTSIGDITMRRFRDYLKYFSLLMLTSYVCLGASSEKLLHVPSPEWRDQVVYFLMTDRFYDGDLTNNDHGFNLYRPKDTRFYSGGDIQGVIDKLDYIKQMGATAVWITPPNANMWYSARNGVSGYHGYWSRNFETVDEKFGDLETYKELSHQLHSNGMFLIQDIVANHVGSYFRYKDNQYDPKDTSKNFELIAGNIPNSLHEQPPFDKVNRLSEVDANANIYNWTPEIADYYDKVQEYTYQTAGLNDLNTTNEIVQKELKRSFSYWIKAVGVDAYRLDTAKYLDPPFIAKFLHDPDGLVATAKSTGREHFPVFGELFETSLPFSDTAEKSFLKYQGTKEKPGINGLIGFPLYKSIEEVFRSGRPTSQISYRIRKQMKLYKDPFTVFNFVDNHDVKRFYNGHNAEAFEQALAFIMTVPGIPVIYQGDEQGLLTPREAMFKGGYLSEADKFNQQSRFYRLIAKLAKVRKENKALSRGAVEILADSNNNAGILAYQRKYKNEQIIVIFNTANHKILAADLNLSLNGQYLESIFNVNLEEQILPNHQNKLVFPVGPKGFGIFKISSLDKSIKKAKHFIKVDNLKSDELIKGNKEISGTSSFFNKKLRLIENGNVDKAKVINTNQQGNWSFGLQVTDLGTQNRTLQLIEDSSRTVSALINFSTSIEEPEFMVSHLDPTGDDIGPTKNYLKPTESSFSQQMDFLGVKALVGGEILELEMKMSEVRTDWNAPNGFDHVAFSLFFDTPDKNGHTQFPLINSNTPTGFNWSFGHHLFGWSNVLFNNIGANANTLGERLAVSPKIKVDRKNHTITITYNTSMFNISSWKNVQLYLTSWDFEEESIYRPLLEKKSRWRFSSENSNGPLILDDIGPFSLANNND